MDSWWNVYIGRPYREDYDCGDFVSDVQRDVFNRDIVFPARISPELDDLTAQIKEHKDEFVVETDSPVDGDGVLMKTGKYYHIGVYFHKYTGYVIHNSRSIGSVSICKVSMLGNVGIKLLGYYRFV